jgi:hypothetical protein
MQMGNKEEIEVVHFYEMDFQVLFDILLEKF